MARALSGRVVLVTGAGRRLGRAIALGLGQAGADVALHCHTSRADAEAAAELVRVDGNRAQVFVADLSVAGAGEPLVAAVEAALGPLTAVVNSASLFERRPALATDAALLDRHHALNVRAPFELAQALARRRLADRRDADVVNLLDLAGTSQTWRDASAYSASRAALASLTRSLALEWAPVVRVNAVAPGLVLPPDGSDAAALEALRARIPTGRLGEVAEVVEAVRFLLAGPRFITGQVLTVDGGRALASL